MDTNQRRSSSLLPPVGPRRIPQPARLVAAAWHRSRQCRASPVERQVDVHPVASGNIGHRSTGSSAFAIRSCFSSSDHESRWRLPDVMLGAVWIDALNEPDLASRCHNVHQLMDISPVSLGRREHQLGSAITVGGHQLTVTIGRPLDQFPYATVWAAAALYSNLTAIMHEGGAVGRL
jgi:hypothetical protein